MSPLRIFSAPFRFAGTLSRRFFEGTVGYNRGISHQLHGIQEGIREISKYEDEGQFDDTDRTKAQAAFLQSMEAYQVPPHGLHKLHKSLRWTNWLLWLFTAGLALGAFWFALSSTGYVFGVPVYSLAFLSVTATCGIYAFSIGLRAWQVRFCQLGRLSRFLRQPDYWVVPVASQEEIDKALSAARMRVAKRDPGPRLATSSNHRSG